MGKKISDGLTYAQKPSFSYVSKKNALRIDPKISPNKNFTKIKSIKNVHGYVGNLDMHLNIRCIQI